VNKKAVVLFSGGLDSILAIKLMLEQGVDAHALYFSSVFNQGDARHNEEMMRKRAEALGVPITIIDIAQDQLELIRDPKHGMGRNMNPCIDCRIMTLKKAKEVMDKMGASFIVTGEVIGERPMSQRKDALLLIDKKSGLGGLIVRPLSAKLLEPTAPEKKGVVDREKFLDIKGRKRDKQIGLAKKLGVNDYPNPSGGCLLTDAGFSNRLRDLLKYNSGVDAGDLKLLKTGRHFRISDKLKLMVGRDEKDNNALLSLARPGDHVFDVLDIPSAVGLARGVTEEKDIEKAAVIMARYSDAKRKEVKVSYKVLPLEEWREIMVNPASESLISSARI